MSGQPADTGTVVLHRVTPEESGDLESTTVAADGSFSFSLPSMPVPGSGEVFFVSHRYDGVLYAGDPVSDPIQLDSVQTLDAYPTEMAPREGGSFPITRREVWINESPVGWEVTDVLEIRNSGDTTFVPQEEDGAVWRYPLPPAATSPRMVQMGPSTGASRFEDGMLVAANPVLPAENYYVIQYDVESIEFDLPMPGQTGLIQLLIPDSAPAVQVQGLARQPNEEIEVGTSFRRWAGQNLSAQTITIRQGEETGTSAVIWLSTALAILLVAVGGWLVQRRGAVAGAALPGGTASGGGDSGSPRLRRAILVDLARLDEAFERMDDPEEDATRLYRQRRAALLAELRSATARGDGPENT